MKNRVVGVKRLKGREAMPSTALRALVSGEVKRGRRLLISSLFGVFNRFLMIVGLRDKIACQNCACAFEHRAQLCELAIADLGLSRARVSRLEAELGGEGRTVDLLEHLHRTYPDRKWALVLGSDLAAERRQWNRFDRIEELARIVPLQRAGFPVPGQPEGLLPQVSSSQVRALLASGADVSHLVPRAVLRAIRAAGTYR